MYGCCNSQRLEGQPFSFENKRTTATNLNKIQTHQQNTEEKKPDNISEYNPIQTLSTWNCIYSVKGTQLLASSVKKVLEGGLKGSQG